MGYPFEPVLIGYPGPGLFLQLEIDDPVALVMCRDGDRELGFIQSELLNQAGMRIARANGAYGVAKFCSLRGDSFDEIKHRWTRLPQVDEFDASTRRKNGLVNHCRDDIAGHSRLVDTMFDAPIWEIASRRDWTHPQLEQLRPRVTQLGVAIPYDRDDERSNVIVDWSALVESGCYPISSAWAAANVAMFWLARAQIAGDPVQYGLAYQAMLTMRRTYKWESDPAVLREFAAGDPAPLSTTDVFVMSAFWSLFGNHLQNRYSLMKVFDTSVAFLKKQSGGLNAEGVPATWYVMREDGVEQGGPRARALRFVGKQGVAVFERNGKTFFFPASAVPPGFDT